MDPPCAAWLALILIKHQLRDAFLFQRCEDVKKIQVIELERDGGT